MGFNKQDVIAYVNKMNHEFDEVKEKGEALLREEMHKNEELKRRIEELKQQVFFLQQQEIIKTPDEYETSADHPFFHQDEEEPQETAKTRLEDLDVNETGFRVKDKYIEPKANSINLETEEAEPKTETGAASSDDEKLKRLDAILEQLIQVKAGEDQIIKQIASVRTAQESALPRREEELHFKKQANALVQEAQEQADKIRVDLEGYIHRVKGELETFHGRIKSSQSNTSQRIDQLETDLSALLGSMSQMDRVMDDVIQGITQGIEIK
jgi:hypothetical protein